MAFWSFLVAINWQRGKSSQFHCCDDDLKTFCLFWGFDKVFQKAVAEKMIPLNWNLLISRRLCKYPLQHNHLPLKFSHIVKIYSSVFLFQYELYRASVGWTWWVKKWFTFIKSPSPLLKFTTDKFNWCLWDF